MKRISAFWKTYKSILIFIFALFIVTRLTLAGLYVIASTHITPTPWQTWKEQSLSDQNKYLRSWAVWDSEWYMKIAEQGYSDSRNFDPTRTTSVGFFPLYPVLIAVANIIIGNSLLSGFLLSNFFLLLAAFLLYLLVKGEVDEPTAKRSVFYLFLFPSAYIFSAVYPESLLLATWIGSIYLARREKWLFAGIVGFFAAMTKPLGFFIFIPLILIYLQRKKFSWKEIRLPHLFSICLVPLGLLTVSFVQYLYTGDMLAYSRIQQGAWHHRLSEPFTTLYDHLFRLSFDWAFNALAVLIFLVLVIVSYKKIPFAYWIFALAVILFIPANGAVIGVLRYFASLFPIIILLSRWGSNTTFDRSIVAMMAILQGCFFMFWVSSYWFLA